MDGWSVVKCNKVIKENFNTRWQTYWMKVYLSRNLECVIRLIFIVFRLTNKIKYKSLIILQPVFILFNNRYQFKQANNGP